MKKIGKILYDIIYFIDKILITPITKLIIKISDIIKNNSKGIERFLNNRQTLIVISFVFALIIFFVVDKNSNSIINNSAEILYNQKLIAEYNQEAYVIEGLPDSVDVTLLGKKSHLYLAKQYSSNLKISADLTDLTPGKHKVTLKISQGLDSVDYKTDPSTATVVIYEKVSETKELDYDVLHKDTLNSKLVINNVDLSRNDCIVKGAEYKLKQVATVKALVDLKEIKNPKEGTITIKDIPLVAYDSKGEVVDVEIVPGKVDASVVITSPSKQVPIKVNTVGTLAFGKSIKNIDTSITTITIYGDQDTLDKLEYLPVEIDVEGLSTNKEYNVDIVKPSGVREISNKTLVVKLTLDDTITKEIENIRITPENIKSGLKAQALSEEDGIVTIIAKGSSDVINSLVLTSIKATVDLSKYTTEGVYEVPVNASGTDSRVTYESKTAKVKIKISKAN